MAPKKKAAAKKEESSSDSDSSSDSSSSEEQAKRKPKSKSKAKAKAEVKDSTEDAAEEKASKEPAEDGADQAEETKKAFEPPPRVFNFVFKPHTDYPDITAAEVVEYCPIDGLPPDFCQYGPSWEKSKPWCMEHYPHYYPELCSDSLDDARKKAEEAADKAKVKELPGGKKKREASPGVAIKKLTRGGRKCVTSVAGLETFGVKLEDAAKKFKKKFSCGASVVKGENGQPDTVDVQGDFEEEIVDLIVEDFKIPGEKVVYLEGGTKKKGKSGR
jgi:density-regulated protein DRP1